MLLAENYKNVSQCDESYVENNFHSFFSAHIVKLHSTKISTTKILQPDNKLGTLKATTSTVQFTGNKPV